MLAREPRLPGPGKGTTPALQPPSPASLVLHELIFAEVSYKSLYATRRCLSAGVSCLTPPAGSHPSRGHGLGSEAVQQQVRAGAERNGELVQTTW